MQPTLPLPAPSTDGDRVPMPASQLPPEEEKSVATHTQTIGIIRSPPDIRSIIDKSSKFVAKNGPDFEKRITINNGGNAKFNFLNASDPYHAYYQHKLSEFRAQNQNPTQQPSSQPADPAAPDSASVDVVNV